MTHSQLTVTNSTYSHRDDAKQPPVLCLPQIYLTQCCIKVLSYLDNTLSYCKQIRKIPRVTSGLSANCSLPCKSHLYKEPMRALYSVTNAR